ncbi:MAG: hydroxymethylbilane synthase [Dehalococcoidia bacterium]|nr:hydroxymethylbilane synthase [Dehalococcoidia bacterium]
MTRTFRIGTRGSALARAQAETTLAALQRAHPEGAFTIVEVSTQGDRDRTTSLSRIGGAGIFVREIESALLEERIDIAVHSLKDMPTETRAGLIIAAVPEREDVRDALVSRSGATLEGLPPGARVGTGSARRMAQLRALRADLAVTDIRGNVDTRLRKVTEGEYDAAVLAVAGLSRLGRLEEATQVLSLEAMLPAPGQGALAVQVRVGDAEALALVGVLDDGAVHFAVDGERAVLAALGGGCLLPVAAHGIIEGQRLSLRALVAHPSGSPVLRGRAEGPAAEAEALGAAVAEGLLRAGARALIEATEATR